jgi:hypothetical protein
MARFAIQHEPTKRWVQEDESGVFLQEDDNYLMTYKTHDLAQKAIDEHYKVYYTTINSDDFQTEDGAYSFEEFIITEI